MVQRIILDQQQVQLAFRGNLQATIWLPQSTQSTSYKSFSEEMHTSIGK